MGKRYEVRERHIYDRTLEKKVPLKEVASKLNEGEYHRQRKIDSYPVGQQAAARKC